MGDRFQIDFLPEPNIFQLKQNGRTHHFNTDLQQDFPLQEWLQFFVPNMQYREVEQDLIFMQSQFNAASWLLLACAVTALNLKESSKTPGGFGSCQAEMVHAVQA